MNVVHGIEGLAALPAGVVLSVGNFDGIHLGHRRLIEVAKGLGGEIAVVTFEPHPLTVLRPEAAPPRLSPDASKQKLLAALGVHHYVILPPTKEVLNLTAEAFWAILRDRVRPSHMIEGRTFNFGKGRGGNIDRLREWSAASAVKLRILEPVTVALLDLSVVEVNSSLIRWLLSHGRVRDSAICLGRPYGLRGKVVEGFRRGRGMGVPTANLQSEDQLVPADGVYAARCAVDGRTYATALSVGTLPTFEARRRQVEGHLVDFDGDLYGHTIEIECLDWIRDQWKFSGVDALRAQIGVDLARVRSIQSLDASRPIARVSA